MVAPPIIHRSLLGRLTEELRYLLFGIAVGGRWHDGHRCVEEPHDHRRCTHLVCDDHDCDVTSCHVVLVPLGGSTAYEWYHHPIWRDEAVRRRERLDAGGMTVRQYKRSLITGKRPNRRGPEARV